MRGEGTGLWGVDPDRFAGVRGLTAAEGDVEGPRRCTRATSPGQMAAEDGRGAGWRRSATQVSSPRGRIRRQRRHQEGSGSARNRARAPVNWVSQGQCWGRCRVRRRAERAMRPAREKKRLRRVLVVAACSARAIRAVHRPRLWAITWTASQAALAVNRPEGR